MPRRKVQTRTCHSFVDESSSISGNTSIKTINTWSVGSGFPWTEPGSATRPPVPANGMTIGQNNVPMIET